MSFNPNSALIGEIRTYAGITAPSGWLLTYGQAISRTTYASLFATLNPSQGTVTMTIASPGVVSKTSHGLVAGDPIYFTTTGALPTGVTAGTKYFVISAGLTANAFEFSATLGGSAVNTSGSQSGTHTLWRSPYGVGDGSTTFNVPDLRGRVAAFYDSMGGTAANRLTGSPTGGVTGSVIGATGGEQGHTLTAAEIPPLPVTGSDAWGATGAGAIAIGDDGSFNTTSNNAANNGVSTASHNNVQPAIILNAIIYTGV